MPSELNRRTVLAAAAAFLLALAVAYTLGSTGQASEGTGSPGAPATPLDTPSGAAGQSSLGDAASLPALAERPKPPEPEPEPEPEEDVVESAPVTPTYSPPPTTYDPPAPTPTPEPPAPEVEFDDSG
jgi:molecular chaperone DnaK